MHREDLIRKYVAVVVGGDGGVSTQMPAACWMGCSGDGGEGEKSGREGEWLVDTDWTASGQEIVESSRHVEPEQSESQLGIQLTSSPQDEAVPSVGQRGAPFS